jgi:hypothetical protein
MISAIKIATAVAPPGPKRERLRQGHSAPALRELGSAKFSIFLTVASRWPKDCRPVPRSIRLRETNKPKY